MVGGQIVILGLATTEWVEVVAFPSAPAAKSLRASAVAKRRNERAVAHKGSENNGPEDAGKQAVQSREAGARKDFLLGMGDFRNSVPRDYWKHFGTLRRMVIWRPRGGVSRDSVAFWHAVAYIKMCGKAFYASKYACWAGSTLYKWTNFVCEAFRVITLREGLSTLTNDACACDAGSTSGRVS